MIEFKQPKYQGKLSSIQPIRRRMLVLPVYLICDFCDFKLMAAKRLRNPIPKRAYTALRKMKKHIRKEHPGQYDKR